jgi:hypothetical protein
VREPRPKLLHSELALPTRCRQRTLNLAFQVWRQESTLTHLSVSSVAAWNFKQQRQNKVNQLLFTREFHCHLLLIWGCREKCGILQSFLEERLRNS